MENRRTLSIGVTINLGNYENLHLEVSDTAETTAQAADLRRFLADVLDDFAQNNATAKDAIDKYRERILLGAESDPAAAETDVSSDEPVSPLMFGFDTGYESSTEPEPVQESVPEPGPELPSVPEISTEPVVSYIPKPPVSVPETPEPKEPEPEIPCRRIYLRTLRRTGNQSPAGRIKNVHRQDPLQKML
jgi:hypothetical protein